MAWRRRATAVSAGLLLAWIACPVMASGGKEAAAADEKGGTLTYWSPFGGDSAKWDQWRIGEFEKANPDVKVNVVFVPDAGMGSGKLLAAVAGGDPPDLVLASNASAAYSFAANGTFQPWDPYVSRLTLQVKDLLPGMKDMTQYQGKTYLLPADSNVILLYMNSKMFREAGLDPARPPATIADLDAMAARLDKMGGSGIERFGFLPWLDYGGQAFYWPWMFGSTIYDSKANKLSVSDQPMVDVYRWMAKYAQKRNPTEIKTFVSGFGALFSPDHSFMTGKIGMDVNGNWFTNAMRIYAPNVEYAVAKVPAPAGGRVGGTVFNSNVYGLPKGAKHPGLAIRFFNFGETTKVLANDFDIWRSIPTNDKQFDEVSWTIKGDPIYKLERELANSPNSGHPALTKVSAQLGNELNALRDEVIYSNKDPLPLLQALQSKFEKMLTQ